MATDHVPLREHRLLWTVPATPRDGIPTSSSRTASGWLSSEDPSILRAAALRRSWPPGAAFRVSVADGPEPCPPLAEVDCRLQDISDWDVSSDRLPPASARPVRLDRLKAADALLRALRINVDACIEAGALDRTIGERLLLTVRDELERVREPNDHRRAVASR